ncbi:MAG: FG-GAP repeat protein [Gammaproteobacteria bacterium]
MRPALYRALVAGQTSPQILRAGCADRTTTRLQVCFGRLGAHFTGPHDQVLSLSLAAFGRVGALVHPGTPERTRRNGRLNYRYAAVTEWWRAVPHGFEQGFSIFRKPAGTGRLALTLNASRSPERQGDGLAWGTLRYGGLAVTDARGRRLPAAITARGRRVTITVNDSDAVYPVTVDPMVWIGQSVGAPAPITANGISTASAFGADVVLDGQTAFVGAPFTTVAGDIQRGAVYVFGEGSDRSWVQSAVLTASNGAAYDQFGSRLAVSGTTLLIGAPGAASARGAAYVFTQSGGAWGQTGELTASDGAAGDEFGVSLAVSGATALVGARYAQVGANARQGVAYLFTQSGGAWSQAGKLTASDGAANDLFGSAVAFEGAEALVGAPAASVGGNTLAGAVYAFAETTGTWSQIQKLVASDGAVGDSFGSALAIGGTTALVGAPEATVSGQVNEGKAYVFVNSAGAWTQTAELIAGDGSQGDQIGAALALDAGRAFVGNGSGGGNAYIFEGGGGTWTQTEEFSGAAGYGEALDLEGLSILVGAPLGGGSIFFYEPTDLALAFSAPAEAKRKAQYTGDVILTNSAATDSPPLSLVVVAPTGASLASAASTQGDCNTKSSSAVCKLGQVAGNGGQAKVNVKFTVTTKNKGAMTLNNFAQVQGAVPSVTASAAVQVAKKKSSGGGGALGLGLLALLGLLAVAGVARRHR